MPFVTKFNAVIRGREDGGGIVTARKTGNKKFLNLWGVVVRYKNSKSTFSEEICYFRGITGVHDWILAVHRSKKWKGLNENRGVLYTL
jgi:hypothetical protein